MTSLILFTFQKCTMNIKQRIDKLELNAQRKQKERIVWVIEVIAANGEVLGRYEHNNKER